MSTDTATFTRGDRVTVDGYDGVAWFVTGPELVWEADMALCEDEDGNEWTEPIGDGEMVPTDRLVCVMVGDDRDFTFDAEDLTSIDEDDFCGSCGQIGCDW